MNKLETAKQHIAALEAVLVRCRDALPTPKRGDPLETAWASAIAGSDAIAAYVEQSVAALQPEGRPAAPAMDGEMALIEKAVLRVGMKSLLHHGAGSLVYSDGIQGVSQGDLLAYTREIALHCAVALGGHQPAAQDESQFLTVKHDGTRVSYTGMLGQCQRSLQRVSPMHAEMLRQLQGHLQELGQRWYAKDVSAVDEILQLYCVEPEAREALRSQQAAQPAAQPAVPAIDRETLLEAIAQGLSGTYHCKRVWRAWSIGTMGEDDFLPVDESDTPGELADMVLALLSAAQPAEQAGGRKPLDAEQRRALIDSVDHHNFPGDLIRATEAVHAIAAHEGGA